MGKINSREHEINFTTCNKGCPKGVGKTKIVLFNKPSKLRYHTVKHMIAKPNKVRIIVDDITEDYINSCREKLKAIGCPYYILDYDEPPCFSYQKGCPDYLCKKIEEINKLEERYVNIILEDLEKCGNLPRYACYYEANNESKRWMLSSISDRRLLTHSAWMGEHERYNLTSCYLKKMAWLTFTEFLNKGREKIENRAVKNSNVFCSRKNWGLK